MLDPLALPGVFSPAECDAIVALAGEAGFAAAGLVRGQQDARIRSAAIAWLDDSGPAAWIMARLVETVAAANRDRFGFALEDFAERLQVARYAAGEGGHFDWHTDSGSGPLAARRKLTVVVQLSDPASYAGGALETNAAGQPAEAPRAQGAALIFPAFVLHRVAPVSAGTRHSLTVWVHGPPFR